MNRRILNKITDNRCDCSNKKGFILIELIVVLVIILLLLAILIPLVTSYINDAKSNAEISEARSVRVAIQTIINEKYAEEDDLNEFIDIIGYENHGVTEKGKEYIELLLKSDIGRTEKIELNDNKVLVNFTYFTVNGSKIVYNDGIYITKYIY